MRILVSALCLLVLSANASAQTPQVEIPAPQSTIAAVHPTRPRLAFDVYYFEPLTLGGVQLYERLVTDFSTNFFISDREDPVRKHIDPGFPDFFISLNWNPPTHSALPESEIGFSLGFIGGKQLSERFDYILKAHLLGAQIAETEADIIAGVEPGVRFWITRFFGLYASTKVGGVIEFSGPKGGSRGIHGAGLLISANLGLTVGLF